jgi:hypothetical protein
VGSDDRRRLTPPDRTRNNQDLTIGARLNEPLPISPHNTIGVAYVRSGINQSFPGSSPLLSANPAERAFEANILLELPRGLIFQPVVQYYMNCGGSSQNAVVLGFSYKNRFLIRRSYAGRCFHTSATSTSIKSGRLECFCQRAP